jgi:hypothetical protein
MPPGCLEEFQVEIRLSKDRPGGSHVFGDDGSRAAEKKVRFRNDLYFRADAPTLKGRDFLDCLSTGCTR